MIQHRPPIKQSSIPREQLKLSLKGCLQVRVCDSCQLRGAKELLFYSVAGRLVKEKCR